MKELNTKLATVDSFGKVTAVSKGTAKITATANLRKTTVAIKVPYSKTLSSGTWRAESRYNNKNPIPLWNWVFVWHKSVRLS
ncbi:Ig-like domain-containing protein [Planococcus shixiaomingii]|uniref:Ig-like domain-containing protein n=1 Tax=Planococcus shixiaomingii TaxID=3058393 RepID=UPI00345CF1BF